MKKPFRVELPGSFYTHTLYDNQGKEVFDLKEAALAADEVYGDEWAIVYNGESAITRENVPESWRAM